MPRISTLTKSERTTKRPYNCGARVCTQGTREIVAGQKYYRWGLRSPGARSGTLYYQHVACGRPRPSQLSRRKTAQIEDAILDAEAAIAEWSVDLPDDDEDMPVEDVISILEDVATVATDVGAEYQEGFDNMPEGLQQGDTGQAMEAVAQELEEWASGLTESLDAGDSPDWPSRDDYLDDEDGQESLQDDRQHALDDWIDQVRNEATDRLGDMPEYQG